MTVHDIRLACLKLAQPQGISNPDVDRWISNARKLEAYVTEGQAEEAPKKRRGRPPKAKADTPSGPVQAVPELV